MKLSAWNIKHIRKQYEKLRKRSHDQHSTFISPKSKKEEEVVDDECCGAGTCHLCAPEEEVSEEFLADQAEVVVQDVTDDAVTDDDDKIDEDVAYEPHEADEVETDDDVAENDEDVAYEPHEADEVEVQIDSMELDELRELAKNRGIANYWSKGRDRLIEELSE